MRNVKYINLLDVGVTAPEAMALLVQQNLCK